MEERNHITEDGHHDDEASGNGRSAGAATATRGKTRRPPYTSQADLDHLFERMATMGEPRKAVDRAWVKSFDLAATQPEAVLSVLKWLGVIDEHGMSTGVWDELRIPASRQQTLKRLMEESYSEIFDQVDVTQATRETLRGAFITAYASGDPGKPIKCFLTLCGHAGIETKLSETRRGGARAVERSEPENRRQATRSRSGRHQPARRESPPPAPPARPAMSVTLNVEIPAEWPDDRVRERIAMLRKAFAE